MGLKKGQCNNRKGRPPGPNKVTKDLRQRLKTFLDKNFQEVEKDFKALDPEKKLLFYEKLLKYAVPQLQNTNLDANINIDKLTESELDTLIARILTKQVKQ